MTWMPVVPVAELAETCRVVRVGARQLAVVMREGRDAALLRAGTRRFLKARLRQKHVRRTARQAIGLVRLDYAG